MELRQAALWIERTINHRMLDRTDVYRHRLAVSLNEDGNAVTGRKENDASMTSSATAILTPPIFVTISPSFRPD